MYGETGTQPRVSPLVTGKQHLSQDVACSPLTGTTILQVMEHLTVTDKLKQRIKNSGQQT